jgi:hypothetical protein
MSDVRRVYVLCPGPSLAGVDWFDLSGPETAAVVAVNRAILVAEADYWVALDAVTAQLIDEAAMPEHRPTLVMSHSCRYDAVASRPWVGALPHIDPGSLVHEPSAAWRQKSLTVACVVAKDRCRATEIVCLGVDWDGDRDFDGRSFGCQKRGAKRWAEERAIFDRLVEEFAAEGVLLLRASRPVRVAEGALAEGRT